MPDVTYMASGGLVTSRDPSDLSTDELVEATGIYYKPGDKKRAVKLGGRSTFGDTGSGAKVKGIALCQFDSGGSDVLIAYSGTTLSKATPGGTGTFASLATGISGNGLSAAHANDRWYLGTGSANRVVESDGTIRSMGMQPPQEAPVITPLVQGADVDRRPNADNAVLTNPSLARDGVTTTFASYTTAVPTTSTIDAQYSFATNSAPSADPTVEILWEHRITGDSSGFSVPVALGKLRIQVSLDAGSTWTQHLSQNLTFNIDKHAFAVDITGLTNADQLKVRFLYDISSNYGFTNTLKVYDIKMYGSASAASVISADATILYAAVEKDLTEGREPRQSPRSDAVTATLVAATNHNAVKIDFSNMTVRNTETTHWGLYKTANAGTATQLGFFKNVPIGDTVTIDSFEQYSPTTQPAEAYPLLLFTTQGATLVFDRDTPPPNFRRIRPYEGSLVGLSDSSKRGMWYSVSGLYESWPSIYVYEKFPLEEHDELVDCIQVGGSLIIGAKAAMMRLDGLPQVSSGNLVGRVTKIQGAPGVVGDYALTAMSVEGEQYAAWISPYGVEITNGHTHTRISDDIEWEDPMLDEDGVITQSAFASQDKSGWVLFWDFQIKCLVLCYSHLSTSDNDRYYLIHMHPNHRKESGQPKWTGPHYGNVAALAAGQVSSAYRRYSAHTLDGKVYLENNSSTGLDSSNAINSTGVHRLQVKSGKNYAAWSDWAALDSRLRHTDFGDLETATFDYTVGRDSSRHEETKTQTIALDGHRGTQVEIGRSGEWHQWKMRHDGEGLGAIQDLRINAQVLGRSGKQKGAA